MLEESAELLYDAAHVTCGPDVHDDSCAGRDREHHRLQAALVLAVAADRLRELAARYPSAMRDTLLAAASIVAEGIPDQRKDR